jgi:serine/threonine-protein kinase
MKGKSPLLTLLVGMATAIVLLTASMNAASKDLARRKTGATPIATATSAPAAVPTSAAPTAGLTAAPKEQVRATYAGQVGGAGATIAIAVHDGTAIAYLCDGRQAEAWLRGTASAGELSLTGSGGASLSGNYGQRTAAGSVVATGKQWNFEVPVATPPSGLYRAATTVANAKIVGGWIVLADGTQVGVLNADGKLGPAPRLDPATGAAVVDGTPVTATPINGATGSGF